jgi:hypothetical protein
VAIARVSCLAQSQSTMHRVAPRLSTVQLIEEFAKQDNDCVPSGGFSTDENCAAPNLISPTKGVESSSRSEDDVSQSNPPPPTYTPINAHKSDSSPSHALSRHSSSASLSRKSRRRSESTDHLDSRALIASAKLAVKVRILFEEMVYRSYCFY